MRKKRLNIKFIIITISLFVVVGALLVVSLTQGTKGFFNKNKAQTNNEVKEPEETKPVEEPPAAETSKFKIYDTTTKTRPYAVMINNIGVARPLQSGLQDAYIIYEMIVEGGITRYLALFRDVKVDRIGSIRSSRHYYLDYVLENDAIYVHNGQSPQAQSDFSTLGINRIEAEAPNTGIRDKSLNVAREHTLFTTTDLLNKAYEKTKFRKETNKEALLAVMNTAYPGARVVTGGDQPFSALFTDLTTIFLPYKDITYLNNCEVSTYIHFGFFIFLLYPVLAKAMKKENDRSIIIGRGMVIILIIKDTKLKIGKRYLP